jgi:hypothetical protein
MHHQQTVMELAKFVSILTSEKFRQRNVGVTPGTLSRSEVPSLFSPSVARASYASETTASHQNCKLFWRNYRSSCSFISFCDDLRGLQEPYGSIT